MAVHLTRIYTRTGDDGTTGLADFTRVAKTDPRLVAYADCDETNATLGLVMALGSPPEAIATVIARIQNELFDLGADLATPVVDGPAYPPLRVTQDYIDRLESDCDTFNADLDAADVVHPARRDVRGRAAASGAHGGPAGRAERLGAAAGRSRPQQSAGGDLPEPAVGPAVHPGQGGEPGRRRDVGARRRSGDRPSRS